MGDSAGDDAGVLTAVADVHAAVLDSSLGQRLQAFRNDPFWYEVVVFWGPVMYVTVTPLLCMLWAMFSSCCKCCQPKDRAKNKLMKLGTTRKFGGRIARRVALTVKANVRIARGLAGSSPTRGYVGITSLTDVESAGGASGNIRAANSANKSEERSIKEKAKRNQGKACRCY